MITAAFLISFGVTSVVVGVGAYFFFEEVK